MLFAEGMNWQEFWAGAVRFLEEAAKFVAAVGVVIVGVLQVWNRRTSIANSTEIKATLKGQNEELQTIRVDCEEASRQGHHVKQAATEIKQAACEVRVAAVEVAKAVGAPPSSPDIDTTKLG